MSKNTRKKYANGTGSTGVGVHNFIQSPAEAMTENSILVAKAEQEAQSDPWAAGVLIAGQVLQSAASSYGGGGQATDGSGSIGTPGQNVLQFANGTANTQGQINAEGGEIVEEPGMAPVELTGPKHESGGVNLDVDPGTMIFSDRIKVGGKTMAQRKALRESRLAKLQSGIESNKTDTAKRNAFQRTQEKAEAEEHSDLAIQQMADIFGTMATFAYGTGPKGTPGRKKMAAGGIVGTDPDDPFGLKALFSNIGITPGVSKMGNPVVNNNPTVANQTPIPTFANNFNTELPVTSTPSQGITLTESQLAEPSGYSNPETAPQPIEKTSEPRTGIDPTPGDYIGLAGNLFSTFAPLSNTLENRAGDTPNVNSFKDFGKDALAANSEAKNYIGVQKDNAMRKVASNARASKRAGRNSARGVNTQRALDLSVDMGTNQAEGDIFAAFANQMAGLFGQQASLENQQDSAVMSGEQQKDLADRQDRDNFYTQKGKDLSTMGQGIQQTGKDVNQLYQNEAMLKIVNQMSEFFKFDKNGNIIGVNNSTKTNSNTDQD